MSSEVLTQDEEHCIRRYDLEPSVFGALWPRCPWCSGKGHANNYKCSACDGAGAVHVSHVMHKW